MVILASVLAETVEGRDAEMSAIIIAIRDEWLLNDTDGPLSELLENRLLGFRISQTEVPPAQIRWHADGQTLVWSDVIFHLSDIREIIFQRIAEARRMLEIELCLSGRSSPVSEIPPIAYDGLVDNWDATAAGQSFLTDSRNACYLDPVKDWLITRVGRTPALFRTFWSQNAEGRWVVSADAAQQYEDAVQRFLRVVMVPFFLGSGQHGRRTEFIGLRWRNTTLTTRDLFLHDGQMLFILSYYKSRHQSNASRWPVRFLLPEVAQLITQYLAIVNPFREFLQRETGGPKPSDYLWSQGTDPWPADTMTRVIVEAGKLILGKHIHIQAWRQITVGIARRKFADVDTKVLIEEAAAGEDSEETDAVQGSMSDALHWQASHTPRTGNRVYGGTVNFRGGLTDAGLQEFGYVSQLWHRFVRDPLHFQSAPVTPQRSQPTTAWEWDEAEGPRSERSQVSSGPRGASQTIGGTFTTPSKRARDADGESPITQRVARRKAPARNRRRWRMEEAQEILQRMYGADAAYRSPGQQQAMEHILAGAGQVLAILRTSEGKSLLYLLPCQLPGAGTTILVLPLVVLKTEIQRRCAEAGIEAHIWGPDSVPDRLHSCPLVVVSVEQAVKPRFREFLHRLYIANELDRVVFDECHMILTAVEYRPAMALLPKLRELACQMVFLTGTMPPSKVQAFEETMLLRGARMVRGLTTRRDINYRVNLCPPEP
ncbi:DNA helicase [Penicillium atrosanguineum]|nr:DNA helicase [Penicillium atrosanguineum]